MHAKTPLWDRLKRDQRLIADDSGLESNVRFLRPYDEVVAKHFDESSIYRAAHAFEQASGPMH